MPVNGTRVTGGLFPDGLPSGTRSFSAKTSASSTAQVGGTSSANPMTLGFQKFIRFCWVLAAASLYKSIH